MREYPYYTGCVVVDFGMNIINALEAKLNAGAQALLRLAMKPLRRHWVYKQLRFIIFSYSGHSLRYASEHIGTIFIANQHL